jgi:hypothetical protein
VEEQVFGDLDYLRQKIGPWDLVLFTGDLVHRGLPDEFKLVDEFLSRMWEKFREWGFTPTLLAVPGNHDLVRPDPSGTVMALTNLWEHQSINKPFWDDAKSEYRQLIDSAFFNYTNWWDQTTIRKPESYAKGMLPGDFSATIEKDGLKFGIVGLNSAFLHLGDDVEEKLAVDVRQFHEVCDGNGPDWVRERDACLLMTHHPPGWLYPSSKQQIDGEIHAPPARFALHLFGHMHEPGLRDLAEGGGDTRRRLQGCSLFSNEPWGEANAPRRLHGYSLVELKIEGSQGEMRLWPRFAAEKQGGGRTIDRDQSFTLDKDKDDGGTTPVAVGLPYVKERLRARPAPDPICAGKPPDYAEIAKLLRGGRIVPFLGPGASEVAVKLVELVANRTNFPEGEPSHVRQNLAAVASYFAREPQMRQFLIEYLKAVFLDPNLKEGFTKRLTPGPLHRLLALNEQPLLLITTNFDDLLEQAFEREGRKYHLVISRGPNVQYRAPGAGKNDFEDEDGVKLKLYINTLEYPVIYKIYGGAAKDYDFVVTEEDHVKFLGSGNVLPIPACIVEHLRKTSFLFLGYGLQDWNFRVMLCKLRDSYGDSLKQSWAIQREGSAAERELWRSHGVQNLVELADFQMTLDQFAEQLK